MTFAPPFVMPARRVLFLALVLIAACAPRARAPRGPIEHPLGVSTAPGPTTPPPLAKSDDASAVEPVTSGLLSGAPAVQAEAQPSSSPVAAAPPTSSAVPVAAPAQYTGGTSSTVVQEPNARIPATPSGVSTETTAGAQPAATVPSGTPDVPATGVNAPPPPSEP